MTSAEDSRKFSEQTPQAASFGEIFDLAAPVFIKQNRVKGGALCRKEAKIAVLTGREH